MYGVNTKCKTDRVNLYLVKKRPKLEQVPCNEFHLIVLNINLHKFIN